VPMYACAEARGRDAVAGAAPTVNDRLRAPRPAPCWNATRETIPRIRRTAVSSRRLRFKRDCRASALGSLQNSD
jgi:hypothetical protein